MPAPKDDKQALREELWQIMSRRNQKILTAQKTDALVLPYFEADDEAATEIIALIDAYTEQRLSTARSDWAKEVMGKLETMKPKDGFSRFAYPRDDGFREAMCVVIAASN